MFKKLICWLLGYWHHDPHRGHKWRRLHKGESCLSSATFHAPQIRICARCKTTRLAATRKRKPKEQTT